MPVRMVEDQKYVLTQIRITFMHNHEQIDVNMNGIADRLQYSKNKKKIFQALNEFASKNSIVKVRDANSSLANYMIRRVNLKGHPHAMWLIVEYVFKNPNKLKALIFPWQSVFASPWKVNVTPGGYLNQIDTLQYILPNYLRGIQAHIESQIKKGKFLNDHTIAEWKIIENVPIPRL